MSKFLYSFFLSISKLKNYITTINKWNSSLFCDYSVFLFSNNQIFSPWKWIFKYQGYKYTQLILQSSHTHIHTHTLPPPRESNRITVAKSSHVLCESIILFPFWNSCTPRLREGKSRIRNCNARNHPSISKRTKVTAC